MMLDERQISEHLLCSDCEQKLGVWDAYAAKVSRKDTGFIALESAMEIPGLVHGETVGASISKLDVDALAKFGASVFWRASVCSKLPHTHLGKYEDEFRNYLYDQGTFPENARLILHLLRGTPDGPTDQTLGLVGSTRANGYHMHSFFVFGLWYTLFVGQRSPPSCDKLCLVRTGRVMVGRSNDMLLGIGVPLVTAPRKGKLAKL
ncbi:hypothetical protein [Sorangium sp. So ce131]|uniref:hypothetical protein n=1 Tax=Sorangium sp. So ce131 TaxID=3133282 RepID=UPI003F61E691